MRWKILSPAELRKRAVAKLEKWKMAKRIVEKKGIPDSANPAFVLGRKIKRVGLSEEEKKRLDSELITIVHSLDTEGREAKIKRLLEAGADVNVQDENGLTPLMIESMAGHIGSVTELIIAYGAELDLQNF